MNEYYNLLTVQFSEHNDLDLVYSPTGVCEVGDYVKILESVSIGRVVSIVKYVNEEVIELLKNSDNVYEATAVYSNIWEKEIKEG